MYSRPSNQRRTPGVPDNYSGVAFRDAIERERQPTPTPVYDIPQEPEKRSAEAFYRDTQPPHDDCKTECDCGCDERRKPECPPPKPPLPFHGLLPHGIGTEEIIIIGLIILMASENVSDDIILLLTILLFC